MSKKAETPVEESAQPLAPTAETPVQEYAEPLAPMTETPVEEPAKPLAPTTLYKIAAIPAAGFCRAGRRWHREGTTVDRADFTAEQWAALEGEPLLIVTAL